MPFYMREGGQFHLHDQWRPKPDPDGVHRGGYEADPNADTIMHSSERVGIAYAKLPDRIHVFTHGTEAGMKAWVESHNEHSPHKALLKVFGQETDPAVLNKAIVDPKYFATLL